MGPDTKMGLFCRCPSLGRLYNLVTPFMYLEAVQEWKMWYKRDLISKRRRKRTNERLGFFALFTPIKEQSKQIKLRESISDAIKSSPLPLRVGFTEIPSIFPEGGGISGLSSGSAAAAPGVGLLATAVISPSLPGMAVWRDKRAKFEAES